MANFYRTTSKQSRVAQRKRAGPITQRSMDRNHPLLSVFPKIFPIILRFLLTVSTSIRVAECVGVFKSQTGKRKAEWRSGSVLGP